MGGGFYDDARHIQAFMTHFTRVDRPGYCTPVWYRSSWHLLSTHAHGAERRWESLRLRAAI